LYETRNSRPHRVTGSQMPAIRCGGVCWPSIQPFEEDSDASAHDVSESTVKREWKVAKAWIYRAMKGGE